MLFVGGGLALLLVVILGKEPAFDHVMGGTVIQAAEFAFTVGLLPIIGLIFSVIVLVLWKRRRQ